MHSKKPIVVLFFFAVYLLLFRPARTPPHFDAGYAKVSKKCGVGFEKRCEPKKKNRECEGNFE